MPDDPITPLFTPKEVELTMVTDWMLRVGPPAVDKLLKRVHTCKASELRHLADHELAVIRILTLIGFREALVERVRLDKELDVLNIRKRMIIE